MEARVATTLSFSRLDEIADGLEAKAAQVVAETIAEMKQDIETAMRLPKSGQQYGQHTASAPGDAPGVDEGDLIGSLRAEMTGATRGEVRAEDPKAFMLEYGTTKMAARPFMTPAGEAQRQKFNDRMEAIFRG